MSDSSIGRMLLSHNFDLRHSELPALKREDFAQVFVDGLKEKEGIECSYIENPHWVVEIIFPTDKYEPKAIGQMCGEILADKRKSQQSSKLATDTLILGGRKTTPATSTSATSLKTGEWGVDVVETVQAQAFLASINWDNLSADKPSDGIFKLEFLKD